MATDTVAHVPVPAQALLDRRQCASQPIFESCRPIHPLLGTRIKSTGNEVGYESHYGVRHTGYISDHRVTGTIASYNGQLEAATVVGRLTSERRG